MYHSVFHVHKIYSFWLIFDISPIANVIRKPRKSWKASIVFLPQQPLIKVMTVLKGNQESRRLLSSQKRLLCKVSFLANESVCLLQLEELKISHQERKSALQALKVQGYPSKFGNQAMFGQMCYKLVWAPSTAVLYLSISKNLSVTLRLLQMYLSRICDLE